MYTPRLGVLGLHKRTVAAVAAVGIVALLALAASMALMQPATVAPKGGTAEGLGLKGIVNIVVRDAGGNVKLQKTVENTIQPDGYMRLLNYSFTDASSSTKLFQTIALVNESGVFASGSGSPTDVHWDPTNARAYTTLQYTYTHPTGYQTWYVTALQITDQQTMPIIFSEVSIPGNGIPLGPGDTLTVTWTIYSKAG